MKFKKEGLKINDTHIDQFDNDHTVVMFGQITKRGRVALELFNIQNSSVVQLVLKNDNIEENRRIKLLRKLPEEQLLLVHDRRGEVLCETTFLRFELATMEVLSVFHRN